MSEKKYLVTEGDLIDSAELCEHCVGNGEDCHGDCLCAAISRILARHEYVERTCVIESKGTWLYCSNCKSCVTGSWADATSYHPMRYCPCCGARVVYE